jgi:starch-binding outer membrane protein, SusD/RagB family
MTTTLSIVSVRKATRRLGAAVLTFGSLMAVTACTDFFNVPNTNQPNLEDLVSNPTRTKLQAAAAGIFSTARQGFGGAGGIQNYIWRLGSMGREGINLSGNNQPDYQEPYFGPLQSTGFGGSQWSDRYTHIRDINIFLDALANVSTVQVSTTEKAGGRGMGNTLKALAFMYLIITRDSLGAPVDVDRTITATPAPFVTKDSVYGYILGLLDSAQADLGRASTFFFAVPPGFTGFNTPATFIPFNRALAAKVEVLRATAAGCGTPCYAKALTALAGSFLVMDSTQLGLGVYYDFSIAPGDVTNGLSEPLNGVTFFAHPSDSVDAQLQPGGAPDQRVINKIVRGTKPQTLGGISIVGVQKFTMYFTGGAADPNHPIPIIRNEELILLDAEAQWFAGLKTKADSDINFVRQHSGHLAPILVFATDSDFVKELIYNRRYSLLWEQGTRWVDARRFHRLSDISNELPSFPNVPTVMPLPKSECDARGLGDNCTPLFP